MFGIMLLLFSLRRILRAILGFIGRRVTLEPEKLKKFVKEIIINTAAKAEGRNGFLQSQDLKKELDAKIDSGEIKTLGQVRKYLLEYQNKEMNLHK